MILKNKSSFKILVLTQPTESLQDDFRMWIMVYFYDGKMQFVIFQFWPTLLFKMNITLNLKRIFQI